MSSANKKTDKGKKRTMSAELVNDRLLEELEAEKARIAELKAARAYADEDEQEERREEGMSAGTGRTGTGEKRRAPERSESPGRKQSRKENPWEATLFISCDECHLRRVTCSAQPGKATIGHTCARCHAKKVRCSFRDPETGLRPRQNKHKDKVSASAGSEADLADLVRTPIQAYFHGGIIDDLMMRMGTMEFKVVQLELGQRAAGLQQIKAESEPESEPGLIPVLVQGEDVEMGEPEEEPEPESIPEVGQPERESRVEEPVGGEERPEDEGEPAIVPETMEEEVQRDRWTHWSNHK
ncbi:hypothetical protein GGX14DRAFT_580056 [Mycena pura]|uniref:Zn(2)-C6 fungal-type domain-containing protein n=1 Tax=Mycena pura TaxID=153505 RepID=A0AAD6ULI8_9AGAR|nr:hypothetical protein GGX14DRAFT_580056 [Mycena pura]